MSEQSSSPRPRLRKVGAIAATVRLQQVALHLALHLALLTGLDPRRPAGLTKVTPTH